MPTTTLPNKERFFKKVQSKIRNKKYLTAIGLAYLLAKEFHRRQTRKSGERYFNHVKAVAWIILTEIEMKNEWLLTILVICALLHDLAEDTYFNKKEYLHFCFDQISPMITKIIWDVTKAKKTKNGKPFDKLLRSIRILTKIIKAADRLHNQRTLLHCKAEKIIRKNKETEEVIIPWLKKAQSHPALNILLKKIQKVTEHNNTHIKECLEIPE